MRKAHRRMHVLLWIVLAPLTLAAAALALQAAPQSPQTDLPDGLVEVR